MSKKFDRQLDKATDSTLIDPNWEAILECVNLIRSGEAPLKNAVASIRKRYHNENPHVAHHALLVLEACMKNCGSKFHAEVATKDFMEDLKNLSLDSTPDKVKNKILELLQCWAVVFKNKPEYKIVVDTHNLMKLAGFDFPKISEADAMFVAESAPEWVNGDECFRCRTAFGLITRKHHCRACGQIFCDKCSSKQSYLPQFGIEKEVRVCDGCFDKTPSGKKKLPIDASSSVVISGQPAPSKNNSVSDPKKLAEIRERELEQAEEDEINLAIALSQSEAEAKEQERQRRLYQMFNGSVNNKTVKEDDANSIEAIYKGAASSKGNNVLAESADNNLVSPELARYLNKEYWQQRRNEMRNAQQNGVDYQKMMPTAPPPSDSSHSRKTSTKEDALASSFHDFSVTSTTKQLDGLLTPTPQFGNPDDEEAAETMEFCRQLKEQVTIMDNRIRSNTARNRSIVNDTAIQSLFIRLTEMHAQVMARMNKLEDQRTYFESLQDHLAHIQEARQAVNALREEHERQKQERALEEQRNRQRQMQQKVDLMRQKKHEMLFHQRHLALLRFQQQEQEIKMKRMQIQQNAQPVRPNGISSFVQNDTEPQPFNSTGYYQTTQPFYVDSANNVYSIPGSYMGNKAGEQVPLERAQMQLFSAGPQYNMAWQEHQMTSSQGHFPLSYGVIQQTDAQHSTNIQNYMPAQSLHPYPSQFMVFSQPMHTDQQAIYSGNSMPEIPKLDSCVSQTTINVSTLPISAYPDVQTRNIIQNHSTQFDQTHTQLLNSVPINYQNVSASPFYASGIAGPSAQLPSMPQQVENQSYDTINAMKPQPEQTAPQPTEGLLISFD